MKIRKEDLDKFEVYTYEEMSKIDDNFDMGSSAYDLFSRVALRRFKEVFKASEIEEVASETVDFRNPFKLPTITASLIKDSD